MKNPASLLLVCALTSIGAWAQPGGGAGRAPRGHTEQAYAEEREPRGHREELRAAIRQQTPPQRPPEAAPGGDRRPRQLSPEERLALRNQLRQQRGENWPRPP